MTTDTLEPKQSTGLLDSVNLNDSEEANEDVAIEHLAPDNSNNVVQNSKLANGFDTNQPKVKPDYLPENFWDAQKGEANLESMSKSWSDLRKQISQGKQKAPANGEYDTAVFGDEGADNPMAETLTNWARDNGLSQVAFDDLVTQLRSQAEIVTSSMGVDPAEEIKMLGPNGQALVNGMADWARGLIKKGIWGSEDWDEFKIMAGTARGINMLAKLRNGYEGRLPIVTDRMEGMPTLGELYEMVADKRYNTDASYRQKVEKLFFSVFKE